MLQIANDRTIDYCDAGTYICKAVWTRNNTVIVHMRNFSLLVEGMFCGFMLKIILFSELIFLLKVV